MDTPLPKTDASSAPIAPRWHTALLVALYVAVAVAGTLMQQRGAPASALPGARGRIVSMYLPLVLVQWSLAAYVCRVGRSRNALLPLLGARWTSAKRAGADLALAACGWAFIKTTELAWSRLSHGGAAASVTAMLPRSVPECLMWVAVSVSAGFCEEVVFRGYFQTQFQAFWGRAGLAVALQAVLFGMAHGEQGAAAAARAALYGAGFGALARWRRSLAPGIACHVWTDFASGLLRV